MVLAGQASAQSLPSNVTEVRSIDPADDDFSDLAAVGKDIGDARIVMLGEQSHGDGSAFLAKSRLVRYLHERLGFDLLVFESGFYDLNAAQAAIDGGMTSSEALRRSVLPVWSLSDQFQPLLTYFDSQKHGDRMLRVAGMDMQWTGAFSEKLPDELDDWAKTNAPSAGVERVSATIRAVRAQRQSGLAALDLQTFMADAKVAEQQLGRKHDERSMFLRQALMSSAQLIVFLKRVHEGTAEVFNVRDAQMAANLEWIAQHNPGKRIIVWGASSHFLRDRDQLIDDPAPNMVSAGSILASHWGKGLYVLAVTSGGGRIGSFATRKETDVGLAPAGTLEEMLSGAGANLAFVPAAGFPGERSSWLLGYTPVKGRWAKEVDGLLFIRNMQPTSYPGAKAGPDR
jgi:erythromycin esterase-like protein